MNEQINDVIRVAQVIGITGCGGVESVVMNYYKNIDRTKVQFDFLVESTSKIIDKEMIESMGGRVKIIPPYSNPFHYMKSLKKLFKQEQYDIVHSNMNTLSVFTLRAAKKAGIKVRIAHSHSHPVPNKKEWKRTILKNLLTPFSKRYATHFFACSEAAARGLFGNKLVDKGDVAIINNAIDINRFKFDNLIRKKIRNEYRLTDKFVVGHIGRFAFAKNHDFLVDIFYEIQLINENSMLLLVGDGPLRESIIQKINKLSLKDKVLFIDTTSTPEYFYQCMDCFLLPSLYEGLPVVGVEAQVNGLKCYFSDVITKEVKISDNITFLSIKQNASKWAKIITDDFSTSKTVRREFLETEKFDIAYQSKKLVSLYQNMVVQRNNMPSID